MINLKIPKQKRIKLYKLAIARNDITEALLTTRLFMNTVKSISDWSFQPLQDAIVIAYARPFTGNKPYGSLDQSWGNFGDAGLEKLHELMLETRNTLIAHSDRLHRNVQIVPKGTSSIPGIETNKDLALTVSNEKIAINMFPRIELLCLDLGGRLDKEIYKLLDELYGDKNLPPEPFDLLSE